MILVAMLHPMVVHADEGGSSVWLPGQFASFAAVPGDPGFSLEVLLYARGANAVAGTDFSRGGGLLAGLGVNERYLYLTPSYTFEQPVLRGQLALALTLSAGRADGSVWGVLTGPGGRSLAGSASDTAMGLSDLYPMASLKWQQGDHNFMLYSLASVPTGIYDPARLAGVGIGHWAIDGGLGYTFLSSSGFEASLTAGLTYNFVNPQTGYQSGLDGHIDAATSWSFGDALYLGVAAYVYNQLSPDIGGNLRLGEFRSRVAGVGPQIGSSFSLGSAAIDASLRGYKEFAAQNRPEGWSVYLTFGFSAKRRAASP